MTDRRDGTDGDGGEISDETAFIIAVGVTLAVASIIFFYAGKMNRATGMMAAGVGIGTAWVARRLS